MRVKVNDLWKSAMNKNEKEDVLVVDTDIDNANYSESDDEFERLECDDYERFNGKNDESFMIQNHQDKSQGDKSNDLTRIMKNENVSNQKSIQK